MDRNDPRYGKIARIRYRGGVLGEEPTDIRMDEPLEIRMGMGDVCPGLQRELESMEVGETRIAIIKPSDGYGEHDPKGVETYSRVMIPGGDTLEVGSVLGRMNPKTGLKMPVRVVEANDISVTIDFNHPLAGKMLEYEVHLDSIDE